MNLDQLTELFGWMSIISVGVLLLSTVVVMAFRNWMGELHRKLFGVKEEHVTLMAYGYLGLLKALIIILVLVPYLSLLMIN